MAETPRLNLPERYQMQSELGRGGMGAVYRVIDLQFQRPLAIKVTLPRYLANPDAVARFQREAQLTGSLQHPGIPPVVDRGTLEDGTPYFSLKLIEGDTLAALLKRRDSLEDDLARFLGIFEQVCQAVGYAHSQSIIHRDLKPENVMVGQFGEVQVMDWGMAKRVSDSDFIVKDIVQNPDERDDDDPTPFELPIDAETVLRSRFDDAFDDDTGATGTDHLDHEVTLTRAGQILGTLSYMPPEQARGEQETLNTQADVFALGGILCKILTGQAPYSGDDHALIYRRVLMGELSGAFAVLDQSQADSELVELCKTCLSLDPSDRPATASAIAEEIQLYEEATRQRLELERTERAAAEAKALEGKKRQRVTAVAAGLAVLLLSALSLGGWWYQSEAAAKASRLVKAKTEQSEREKQARADIASALERVPALREQYQFEAAEALLIQAESRLEVLGESGELAAQVAQAGRDLEFVKELDRIRLQISAVDGDLIDREFAIGAQGDYAQAYRRYGLDILSSEPKVLAEQIKSASVSGHLVDGLDAWNTDEHDRQIDSQLLLVLGYTDQNPIHQQLRDPSIRMNETRRDELIQQLDLDLISPAFGRHIADLYNGEAESDFARGLYRQLLIQHPGDFWLHYDLAFLNERYGGSLDECLGHYQAALAVRPDVALVYLNIGNILYPKRRFEEAERSWLQAIRCDPNDPDPHMNLGELMKIQERYREAEQELRTALKLSVEPLDIAYACHYLGDFLQAQGRLQESIPIIDRGLSSIPQDHSMYDILLTDHEYVTAKLKTAELAKPLVAPRLRND